MADQASTAAFATLFLRSGIRVQGTALQPLFCVSDVAAHIGDQNVRRIMKNYDEKCKQWAQTIDVFGRRQEAAFFTERGLCRYLLQSRRKEAEAFQGVAYDLLAAERRRVMNAAQLEAKIARDAAAALGREAEELRRALHRAREPREPSKEVGTEEYISYCYDHLLWSRPDLAELHNPLLVRGTLPLPWDLHEDLLRMIATEHREQAFVRFMQHFSENFPVRGAAAEREGPARAPTDPPCPP